MSQAEEVAGIVVALHRAGWSIGDVACESAASGMLWLVSGRNGENLIRAEAPTKLDAWRLALGQGMAVAMPRVGCP